MRHSSLFFGFGLLVLVSCGWAAAQDAAKPRAIQVTIGPDGVVKVIDANTGQQIAKPVSKAQAKPGPRQRQPGQQGQSDDKQQYDDYSQQIERILKSLHAGQDKRAEGQQDKRIDFNPKTIRIVIGPDGKAQIIQDRDTKKPATPPAGTVEQKLDLILKQLGELRKDVDTIKKKLDGKQPDNLRLWQVVPTPGKDTPKDKKPGELKFRIELPKDAKPTIDPEIQKRLDELIKQLEKKGLIPDKPGAPRIQFVPRPGGGADKQFEFEFELKDILKKIEKDRPNAPPAPNPAELRRRIEQLQQQLEQLQRELRDKKSAK